MPVTTYHYAGPGVLVGENRNGTQKAYRQDGWGSTSQMIDTNAIVTDTFEFDYYGNQIARTGTTGTPFRWRANSGMFTQTGSQNKFPIFYPPITRYPQGAGGSRLKGPIAGRGWTYDPVTGELITDPFAWAPPESRPFFEWFMDQIRRGRLIRMSIVFASGTPKRPGATGVEQGPGPFYSVPGPWPTGVGSSGTSNGPGIWATPMEGGVGQPVDPWKICGHYLIGEIEPEVIAECMNEAAGTGFVDWGVFNDCILEKAKGAVLSRTCDYSACVVFVKYHGWNLDECLRKPPSLECCEMREMACLCKKGGPIRKVLSGEEMSCAGPTAFECATVYTNCVDESRQGGGI